MSERKTKVEQIIENRAAELETTDNIKNLIINLNSFLDFQKDLLYFVSEVQSREVSMKEIDEVMDAIYNKWTFIFCSILSLDIQNPFILKYAYDAIKELSDELIEK